MERKSEKIGWIGGWIGGFFWLGLLSGILIVRNRIGHGLLGLLLFAAAIITIFSIRPWKYPDTKYWKLMTPVYALLFLSIALFTYVLGGLASAGLHWTSFFWAIPCLIPFITMGNRTWNGKT